MYKKVIAFILVIVLFVGFSFFKISRALDLEYVHLDTVMTHETDIKNKIGNGDEIYKLVIKQNLEIIGLYDIDYHDGTYYTVESIIKEKENLNKGDVLYLALNPSEGTPNVLLSYKAKDSTKGSFLIGANGKDGGVSIIDEKHDYSNRFYLYHLMH